MSSIHLLSAVRNEIRAMSRYFFRIIITTTEFVKSGSEICWIWSPIKLSEPGARLGVRCPEYTPGSNVIRGWLLVALRIMPIAWNNPVFAAELPYKKQLMPGISGIFCGGTPSTITNPPWLKIFLSCSEKANADSSGFTAYIRTAEAFLWMVGSAKACKIFEITSFGSNWYSLFNLGSTRFTTPGLFEQIIRKTTTKTQTPLPYPHQTRFAVSGLVTFQVRHTPCAMTAKINAPAKNREQSLNLE